MTYMKNHRLKSKLLIGMAGMTALSITIPGCRLKSKKDKSEPNLLIIMTDQLGSWALGAYGAKFPETPFINSLAEEGAILTNYFTNSAVSTPSRACFLTGRYPHAHGAYKNNIPLNRDEITIAKILQNNGYETGYSGKWHLDGTPKPGWVKVDRSMGFEDCRFMFNRGHYKKVADQPVGDPIMSEYKVLGDEKTYMTDWLSDKTVDFITKERTKPFFYMLSIPDPHQPFTVREPYDTIYSAKDMIVPPTFDQENLPDWAVKANKRPLRQRIRQLKKIKAQYLGEVKCIDDNVGKILASLKESGQLDNTIVVFTTDHGEYMGEHGLMYKNNLYEPAYRIPFLIRWPEKIPHGIVVDKIISIVDVQQTLLGLMGFEPCGREQGFDASKLLKGKKLRYKEESFTHHSSLNRAGIFTPEYQLAYTKDRDAILFNRINDPEQKNNLFDDPDYQKVISELTDRIIQHNIEVEAPALEWLKDLKNN